MDMKKIKAIIEDMPYITALQKEFYTTILQERKIRILDVALEKTKGIIRALAKKREDSLER